MTQPEARLVGLMTAAASGEQARRITATGSPALLASAPVEAPPEVAAALPRKAAGRATTTAKAPGYWRVETASPTGGLLVVTDRAYPGWHAYLDGRPTWWGRAYGCLKAAAVPRGRREVVFVYWPATSVVGGALMFLSLAALAALGVLGLGRRHTAGATQDGQYQPRA
jgi:hypothetical protein